MIKYGLLILSLIFFKLSYSSNIVSTSVVGNWSTTTSWVGGIVPGSNDSVFIVSGARITLNIPNVQIIHLQINTSGTLTCGSNTLSLSGRFSNNGTFNANNGTVVFNGFSFKQPILGNSISTFNHVVFNNTNGTLAYGVTAHPVETRITGNVVCNGVFNRNCTSTPNAFIHFMGTSVLTGTNSLILHHVTIDAGAVVNHQTPNLYITGNWLNNGTFNPNTNTVNFDFSSCSTNTQSINNGTSSFYNVRENKGTTFTVFMDANTTILNNFINVAGIWNSQTYSLSVGGDFKNSGTYSAGTGLLLLNGTVNQNIGMGGSSLYNFRINKSGGNVYGLSIVEVTNNADLINGIFYTHPNIVPLPNIYELFVNNTNPTGSLTSYSANSFVVGKLRRKITSALNNYFFPVGPINVTPIKYRPISYQQTSSGGATTISIIEDTISVSGNKANWYAMIESNTGNPVGNFGFSYGLSSDFPAGIPECAIVGMQGTQPPPANWNYVLNTIIAASGGNNGSITSAIPPIIAPYAFILGEPTPVIPDMAICTGKNATLTVTSPTGYVQYNWWNANTTGTLIQGNSVSYVTPTLTNTTSYYIQSTAFACIGLRTAVTVSVNSNPIISVSNVTPQICTGNAITISATGATSYSWSNGTNNASSINVSPIANTVYTVTGADGNGCKGVATSSLTVNSYPTLVSSTNDSTCHGGQLNLAADFGTGIPVNWYSDAALTQLAQANSNTYQPTPSTDGIYTYYAQGSNGGCNSLTQSVTAFYYTINAIANADVYSGVAPLDINFSGSNSNGITTTDNFSWLLGDGTSSNTMNTNHTFNTGGVYNVVLAVNDVESGCKDTVDLLIIIDDAIFIPTIFTPNGDGKNDKFEIKGLVNYPDNNIQIFNRWGGLVYSKQKYNNDWEGEANVGDAIGKRSLPMGTYYVVLDFGDGKTKPYNGFVHLVE